MSLCKVILVSRDGTGLCLFHFGQEASRSNNGVLGLSASLEQYRYWTCERVRVIVRERTNERREEGKQTSTP